MSVVVDVGFVFWCFFFELVFVVFVGFLFFIFYFVLFCVVVVLCFCGGYVVVGFCDYCFGNM